MFIRRAEYNKLLELITWQQNTNTELTNLIHKQQDVLQTVSHKSSCMADIYGELTMNLDFILKCAENRGALDDPETAMRSLVICRDQLAYINKWLRGKIGVIDREALAKLEQITHTEREEGNDGELSDGDAETVPGSV